MITLDRLLWFPKDTIEYASVVSELVMIPMSYTGKLLDSIKMYELVGDKVGVPRQWGLQNLHWLINGAVLPFKDDTKSVFIKWPEVKIGSYWEGQLEAIESCVLQFQTDYDVLLEAKAGSGKTLMGLAVAAKLNQKALILVHKNDLAKQWHDTARKFFPGVKMGHIQQDSWDYKDKHIVTASTQTLYSRLEGIKEITDKFGMVIVDECHRYPARTFEKVIRCFPARYRLGVSATYRRSDGLEQIWQMHLGAINCTAKTVHMVGKYVQIDWHTRLNEGALKFRGRINRAKYISAISKSAPFIEWIAKNCRRAANKNRKVLVVSDRVKMLKEIGLHLKGYNWGLYIGEMSKDRLRETKKCDIILATYGMMAEGTDIPELDTLIIATPRADVEQVVGRIQRFAEGKKEPLIVDPVFQTRYGQYLGKKRKKTYSKLGFQKLEVTNV